jgi:signal transduction histidine kinase
MTQSSELALVVASLLERHTEEIASACADALVALPGSRYQSRPRADMLASARRQTAAMVALLRTGSDAEMDRYIDAVIRARLGQGFDVSELIQAALLWRDKALPFIWEALSPASVPAAAATGELDAFMRYQVGRFGQVYAEAMGRELQEQQRRTALMLHAVQTASRSLELDQVLQQVGQTLSEAIGATRCGIYLVDSDGQVLVPRALVGETSEARRALFWSYRLDPAAETILREAIERREPAVCYDAPTDPRISQEAVQAWGLRSLLIVPITAGERVLGLALLATFEEPRAFTLAEIELAQGVAGAVALAVENARLYEETRRLYQQGEQLAIIEERQRIARELHDSVTQSLYGVTLYAEVAGLLLDSGDLTTLAEHLREIQSISQQALREMRLLIFELRPPILEQEGLVAAIEARLEAVEGRGGVSTELRVEGEPKLTRVVEEEIYRIAQEALNNVLKHSRARRTTVQLTFSDERVCLEVFDDGVGFDPSEGGGKGGLGLKGMAERARQIGGALTIDSAPGQGTRLRIEVDVGSRG